jgi:hypothetical protein
MTNLNNNSFRSVGAGKTFLAPTDFIVQVDTSAGAVELVLPKIDTILGVYTTIQQFMGIRFVDISDNASVNNITLTGFETDNINGSTNIVLNTNGVGGILTLIGETDWSFTQNSTGGGASGVASVTGLDTDNTDPLNPIVNISVDGTTITGDGTPASPLQANVSGVVPSLQQVLDFNHDLVDANNYQGTGAGECNTGINVTASGYRSAFCNTGCCVNAFGTKSAYCNIGSNVNSNGTQSAYKNTGNCVNAIGTKSSCCNTGCNVNSIGTQSAYCNIGSCVNSFGFQSAFCNTGNCVNAIGIGSAVCNTGCNVNSIGTNSAYKNTGCCVNAFGNLSAQQNSGCCVNAFGICSAILNTGVNVSAIGTISASNNAGTSVNAFGYFSACRNTGNCVIAIGQSSAFCNIGDCVVAIGKCAGCCNCISSSTILGNTVLPSYVDFASASASITIIAGASAGSTYLFYNQSNCSIEAIRL